MAPLAGNLDVASAKHFPLTTSILVWCGLVVVSSLYVTLPMVPIFASVFKAAPATAAWVASRQVVEIPL